MDKNPIKLRTVFMGTSDFASTILEGLLDAQYNIVGVYTQPDRRAGREQELKKTAVKQIAEKAGIAVFQPEKLDQNAANQFKYLKPDLAVVVAYGNILPKGMLEVPGFGTLNVHASLLPKFRGSSPIQNAILQGEKETGITIMLMDAGIDTGAIITQDMVPIGEEETYLELSKRLSKIGRDLLLSTLPLLVEGKIVPKNQDSQKVTLCQLIEREDGKINWTDEASSIYSQYRALTPWPGLYTFWKRDRANLRLKVNKIHYLKNNSETPRHLGEEFEIGDKIGVQTVSGIILLEEIQLEGKNNVKAEEFKNGYPDFLGSILI
jgi:methionyl-tRNA formyltransferase